MRIDTSTGGMSNAALASTGGWVPSRSPHDSPVAASPSVNVAVPRTANVPAASGPAHTTYVTSSTPGTNTGLPPMSRTTTTTHTENRAATRAATHQPAPA